MDNQTRALLESLSVKLEKASKNALWRDNNAHGRAYYIGQRSMIRTLLLDSNINALVNMCDALDEFNDSDDGEQK